MPLQKQLQFLIAACQRAGAKVEKGLYLGLGSVDDQANKVWEVTYPVQLKLFA